MPQIDHNNIYNSLYSNLESFKIHCEEVVFDDLKTLIVHFNYVKNLLKSDADYQQWNINCFYPISRYLYEKTNTICSFKDGSVYLSEKLRDHNVEKMLSFLSTDKQTEVENLIQKLESLFAVDENPIFDLVLEPKLRKQEPGKPVSIVFSNNVLMAKAHNFFVDHENTTKNTQRNLGIFQRIESNQLHCTTAIQLKNNSPEFFDSIFAVGTFSQFPENLTNFPKCKDLHFFGYDFFGSPKGLQPYSSSLIKKKTVGYLMNFEKKIKHVSTITFYPRGDREKISETLNFKNPINPAVLSGNDLFEHFENVHRMKSTNANELLENVLAISLSNMRKIFLNPSDIAKETIIDTSKYGGTPSVKQVFSKEINSGDFILTRTETDSDYLRDKVDSLLGDNVNDYRSSLSEWKQSLAKIISKRGIAEVTRELENHGALSATKQNVINWISYSSYGPQDRSDFIAIMKYLQVEENKSKKDWNIILQMRQASVQSGKLIAKELRAKLRNTNLDDLESLGEYKFTFDGIKEQLTAFRVENITTLDYPFPIQKIKKVFSYENITEFYK